MKDPDSSDDEEEAFDALLEASSLGAPHVKAAAEEVPEEVREQLRRASVERNQSRIAEGWAEHEARMFELEELRRLTSPTPSQLRRIAELQLDLHGMGVALRYWRAAADAGDQDAKDIVADWDADFKG
ncbi:hypothetical protein, partial [Streptomyces sp. MBT53]|uniref:hypothetical protein n=1 Tax=Streptomyces sp. MBT53 TaxID=1488384 RepID=UPI0019116075